MNSTEIIERQTQKYSKALLILEGLQASKHKSMPLHEMTSGQVYILMDDELYDWHETLECWQSIF